MKKRRSLFLLEVVIAIALVGFFSVYFLHSSLYQLYEERKALLELEFAWQGDLLKMDFLETWWNKIPLLPTEGLKENKPMTVTINKKRYSQTVSYELRCKRQSEKGYLLGLKEENKDYCFFIKK